LARGMKPEVRGDAQMPERLDRYVLDSRVARGTVSEVFVARQVGPGNFERRCAVKRLLPGLAADGVQVRLFVNEVRLLGQLMHPHIVQTYDFGEARGTYFLVMEYVEGASLRQILEDDAARGATLPWRQVARIACSVAAGLHHAHELGMVHRGVCPENVLVSKRGHVKLIDFGAARAGSASIDRREDVRGLGLLLYELLAGKDFPGHAPAAGLPPIDTFRGDLPRELRSIVGRALRKKVEQRYVTAEDVATALDAVLARNPPIVEAPELAALLPVPLQADGPAKAARGTTRMFVPSIPWDLEVTVRETPTFLHDRVTDRFSPISVSDFTCLSP
jgi:serine/threonine protein kinase